MCHGRDSQDKNVGIDQGGTVPSSRCLRPHRLDAITPELTVDDLETLHPLQKISSEALVDNILVAGALHKLFLDFS